MNKNKQSGITLIALVITIIVLLILAGVTIATISGNNSAPQKATEAAQKDAIAGAKDEIAMETQEALLNYYNNKYVSKTSTGAAGEASAQSIVAEAAGRAVTNAKSRNKELDASSVSGNKITLKTKSYVVKGTIEENGGITWSDYKVAGEEGVKIKVNGNTVTVTEANAKDYYGTTVKTINVNNQNVEFGLFYIDFAGTYSGGEEGTVYLRAKSSIGNTALNGGITTTDDQAAAIEIMKKINPQWNTARGTTAYSSFTSAEKGAAYLCNPNNTTWSGIGSEFGDDLNYVIGAPSVELYLASYNAKYNTTTYSADFRAAGVNYTYPGYLYSNNGGTSYSTYYSNAIQTGDATVGGMYRNSSVNEWLASPLSNIIAYDVCYVDSDGGLYRTYWNTSYGVAPLVSLKSEVDLTTTN